MEQKSTAKKPALLGEVGEAKQKLLNIVEKEQKAQSKEVNS